MRALKVLLFIFFVFSVIYGLLLIITPTTVAEANWGPQDAPSARYMGATYLGLSAAIWYAFRNPRKNVAVVRAIITLTALSVVVAIVNGVVGDELWSSALPTVIAGIIFVVLLAIFSPRGEKAT